jgi:hypothetical protein
MLRPICPANHDYIRLQRPDSGADDLGKIFQLLSSILVRRW